METFIVLCLIAVIILLCHLTARISRLEKLIDQKNMIPHQKKPAEQPPQQTPVVPEPSPQQKQSVDIPIVSGTQNQESAAPVPKANRLHPFIHWLLTGSSGETAITEFSIATVWLIRCGILILLCAAGFFLKYSIENSLFPPVVRITITYAVGVVLFAAGYYGLHKRYHRISIAIVTIGIILLYMGTFTGYRLYKIIPINLAFCLMLLTSIGTMYFSSAKGLLPVALTGCSGAFLTPVMLSNGSGNLPFLYGYLAATSACILIVSRVHRWRSLEWEALAYSGILILASICTHAKYLTAWCLLFLILNFTVYTLIPVIRKKEQNNGITEWLLPLFSIILCVISGLAVLFYLNFPGLSNPMKNAMFTLLIACITFLEVLWLLWKRPDAVKIYPAYYCCTALALAITIPLAASSPEWLAGMWAILALIFIFASVKTKEKTLFILGIILYIVIFLCIHVSDSAFLNQGKLSMADRFFRNGIYTISLFGSGWCLWKFQYSFFNTPGRLCSRIFYAAATLALLVYTSWEIYLNIKNTAPLFEFRHGGLSVWWAVFATVILTIGLKKDWKFTRIAALGLFALCLIKVALIDIDGLNTLGKVIALLLVGILLLGGATGYIYFRNKKNP